MGKKKSVLVAGATGFVGKELVAWLIANDMLVTVLTRNPLQAKKIFPQNVDVLKWPTAKEKLLMAHCKTCDVVINLAGASIGSKRWTKGYKNLILESRAESIQNLNRIVAAMPQNPELWIQASAIGYYGCNTATPVDESGQRGTGFLADVVFALEQELDKISVLGMRKVTLRLGIVINKSGGFFNQMVKAFNMGLGVIPGSGQQHISWIHTQDLTEIFGRSITDPRYSGIINVVAPEPIAFSDFAKLLKSRTRAFFVIKVPALLFRLFLGKEKTNELLLANQKIEPKMLKALGFRFEYPNFKSVINR